MSRAANANSSGIFGSVDCSVGCSVDRVLIVSSRVLSDQIQHFGNDDRRVDCRRSELLCWYPLSASSLWTMTLDDIGKIAKDTKALLPVG